MSSFSNILSCSIAPTGFQLVDYSLSEKPRAGGGREVVIDCTGTITAESDAAAATAMSAFKAAVRAASGQPFVIRGAGGVVLDTLTPAECRDGGPHFSFATSDMGDGGGGGVLEREVSFSVSSDRDSSGSSSSGGSFTTVKTRVRKGSDGRDVVSRSGTLVGTGLTEPTISAAVFAPFASSYPTPHYVITSREFDTDELGTEATWSIEATRLTNPLPGGAMVLDGEATREEDRDENFQKTVRYSFDLVITPGNEMAVMNAIRPTGLIISEKFSVTLHKESRISATFVLIQGADGTAVTEWKQSIKVVGGDQLVEERRYVGIQPILIQSPLGTPLIVQSGTAVAIGAAVKEPPPINPGLLAQPVEIDVAMEGLNRWRTTWTYAMYKDDSLSINAGEYVEYMKRPQQFEFHFSGGTTAGTGGAA